MFASRYRRVDVDPCHPHAVALADALVATMRASPACVGLAATQVGEPARLFCMDVTGHRRARSCAGLVVLCNPTIVWRSNDVISREGCMSVPHLTGNVARVGRGDRRRTRAGHRPCRSRERRRDRGALPAARDRSPRWIRLRGSRDQSRDGSFRSQDIRMTEAVRSSNECCLQASSRRLLAASVARPRSAKATHRAAHDSRARSFARCVDVGPTRA